jgi:hypothetical protein
MRHTVEYSRDIISGPTPAQTKSQFEEAFQESDRCYNGGDTWETCAYFQMGGKSGDLVEVYLAPNSADFTIKNSEKPFLSTSDWNQFDLVRYGGVNYIPEPSEDPSQVSIWWSHDMKFNQIFYWEDINDFDPKNLKVCYSVDQDGHKYFEDLIYDDQCHDESHDNGDTGHGYNGINFIYHRNQKFAEESDDD